MKQSLHRFELGACGCAPSPVRLVQRVAVQGLSGSGGSFPGCPRVLRPLRSQSPRLRAPCTADEGTPPAAPSPPGCWCAALRAGAAPFLGPALRPRPLQPQAPNPAFYPAQMRPLWSLLATTSHLQGPTMSGRAGWKGGMASFVEATGSLDSQGLGVLC